MVAEPLDEPEGGKVVDLMAALEASVDAAKAGRSSSTTKKAPAKKKGSTSKKAPSKKASSSKKKAPAKQPSRRKSA